MRNISQTMSKNMIFVKTQKAKRWSFPPPGIENSRARCWNPNETNSRAIWKPFNVKTRVTCFNLLPASRLLFTYFLSPQNLLWFTSKTIVPFFFKMRVVTFWATRVTDRGLRVAIWTRAKRRLAEVERQRRSKCQTFSGLERERLHLFSHTFQGLWLSCPTFSLLKLDFFGMLRCL